MKWTDSLFRKQRGEVGSARFMIATRTIDYSKSIDFLAASILPHGTIPRETLFNWYSQRGREMRFEYRDIEDLTRRAFSDGRVAHTSVNTLPDAPNTVLCRFRRSKEQQDSLCVG